MSKKVSKVFIDVEKESQWLNEMAAKGWNCTGKSFLTYEFEPCEPGEYLYQIELTASSRNRNDKQEYLEFLQDAGIERICNYWGWSYFRSKNNGREFKIFTDHVSILRHYKRIMCFYAFVLIINLSILNKAIGKGTGPYLFNISIPFVSNLICGIAMIMGVVAYYLKMKKLRSDMQIEQ